MTKFRIVVLIATFIALTMSAAAQTQWPATDGATAYAVYSLPTPATATPATAPTAGVVIPAWANRVVMEVRDGDVMFAYNITPTATIGIKVPAGTIIVWPFYDMLLFRSIRWYGLEADSKVALIYSRASREQ